MTAPDRTATAVAAMAAAWIRYPPASSPAGDRSAAAAVQGAPAGGVGEDEHGHPDGVLGEDEQRVARHDAEQCPVARQRPEGAELAGDRRSAAGLIRRTGHDLMLAA